MILSRSSAEILLPSNLLIAETLVVLALSVCYSKPFTSHALNVGQTLFSHCCILDGEQRWASSGRSTFHIRLHHYPASSLWRHCDGYIGHAGLLHHLSTPNEQIKCFIETTYWFRTVRSVETEGKFLFHCCPLQLLISYSQSQPQHVSLPMRNMQNHSETDLPDWDKNEVVFEKRI